MDEHDMTDLECPFCGIEGFDKVGLKYHLLGYGTFDGERLCKVFAETEDI